MGTRVWMLPPAAGVATCSIRELPTGRFQIEVNGGQWVVAEFGPNDAALLAQWLRGER